MERARARTDERNVAERELGQGYHRVYLYRHTPRRHMTQQEQELPDRAISAPKAYKTDRPTIVLDRRRTLFLFPELALSVDALPFLPASPHTFLGAYRNTVARHKQSGCCAQERWRVCSLHWSVSATVAGA